VRAATWLMIGTLFSGCIPPAPKPVFEPPVPSHRHFATEDEIRGAVFRYQLTQQHWPACAADATQDGVFCLRIEESDPDPELMGKLRSETNRGVRRASECDAKHGEAMREHKTGKSALLLIVHTIEHDGESANVYGRYHAGGRCWATYNYHLEHGANGWEVTLAVEDIHG
jgi:hypothetical protein